MTAHASVPLETFTARFTPEAKRRLMALAQIHDTPAYLLLEEAFWSYWKSLPPRDRKAVDAILRLIDDARSLSADMEESS